MTRTVTAKELRPQLPRVLDAVDRRLDRFIVTRRGKPTAVIMSADDYEGLLETIEILQDKTGLARLRQAEREVKQGRTRSLEEIDRSLRAL